MVANRLTSYSLSVWFPSPCGVNIVGNAGCKFSFWGCSSVSVPLRGKYCRESVQYLPVPTTFFGVSVPLRGKYCREWSGVFLIFLHYKKQFPSPCGVNIVGNPIVIEELQYRVGPVSVPLRGKYCREFGKATYVAKPRSVAVSVPLRGKYCRELWIQMARKSF